MRCIVLTHGLVILAKDEIEHPVKSVFYSPMGTYCNGELSGTQVTETDVIAYLQGVILSANNANSIDMPNRFALGLISDDCKILITY